MLDQSAGPSGHGRRSLDWITLDDAEHHVISRLTLEELARLVGRTVEELLRAYRTLVPEGEVVLRDNEVEELAGIGSVARLQSNAGQHVAVARIGRTSLIGFIEPENGAAEVRPIGIVVASS